MKTSRILTAVLAAAGCAAMAALPARAQVTTAPPIRVKVKAPKSSKPQRAWFKGEVLHADAVSLIVRSRTDPRFIRTFTYSPRARERMDEILADGGYQYGDKVEVRYESGRDVALEIRGRPSKPL